MFDKKNWLLPATVITMGFLGVSAATAQNVAAAQAQAKAQEQVHTTDYLVPHISTVPANLGKHVGLFVREKVQGKQAGKAPVVLMIGGATISAVPDFDVQFENYSWMEYLAKAGFDVFTLDHTGYGLSPRPMMENPCNITAAQQQQYLMPAPVSQTCTPAYPFQLTSLRTDWDEIDRVVDYLRQIRNVDKVNLVGWSRGGNRVAGYAGLHPEKVSRMLLYAPGDTTNIGYNPLNLDNPPQTLPLAGVPTAVSGANDFFLNWDTQVSCTDQFAPGIRPVIRQTMLDFDPLGSSWGTAGVRRAPNLNISTPNWGLNKALAGKITAPTLIIRGDLDQIIPLPSVQALYADLVAAPQKVFVHVACASHNLVWENQHMSLLDASVEWLQQGTYQGQFNGAFAVDTAGKVSQEQ